MTANELADIVDHWAWKESAEYLTDAAAMLRQQQAEIEALKKKTQYWLHTLHCTCGNHWEISTYPPVLKEKEFSSNPLKHPTRP